MSEFRPFGKIPRFSREVVITEKIDGTNASVYIEPCPEGAETFGALEPGWVYCDAFRMRFGSRTRWITPEDDNHGFARWAIAHAPQLAALGPGHHFGEWWGKGINRGYGMQKKRFSLFNVSRWIEREEDRTNEKQAIVPSCCHVVPVITCGILSDELVAGALGRLYDCGSVAAGGFMDPEGIVIYHTAAGSYFKKTLKNDAERKSKKEAACQQL